MSTLALIEERATLLASLRRLRGRGTVGDLASESGLPLETVRSGLKSLLESHRGHLSVSESGELLYDFDPKLLERDREPFLSRAARTLKRALSAGFKAWIVVMLVGYFVLFVVLVIAALFASQRGGDSRRGWGRGGRHGGRFPMPNVFFWYWIWGPRWRVGRPYYGRRWERTLDREDKVPFYKKVFAFVFGPDRPRPTQSQLDRSTLRLIRARRGVITTGELVEHTALPRPDAEGEMGRLLGAYDGEAVVSPAGEIVYAFPDLVTSVGSGTRIREPNPAWLRLEHPLELTGNGRGTNALIAGMNAFTLAAAASSPWFIFPRLGIGGPAAFVALVLVPVVFSVLFFGVPLLRTVDVKRENRRRRERNVRRVLLGLVYQRTLHGGEPIDVRSAHAHVARHIRDPGAGVPEVEGALHALAAEFDADVEADEEGALRFTFPAMIREFAAGETVRRRLALDERELGGIVFSTADSPAEAHDRDLALFDQALDPQDADLERYVPSADRTDFEDDYAVVAFEDELNRS